MTPEAGQHLAKARQELAADYAIGPDAVVSREDAAEAIDAAATFVATIGALLTSDP